MGTSKFDLYKCVEQIRLQLKLDITSYPINTIKLCNGLNNVEMIYHDFNTRGVCGAILLGDIKDTVILNSLRSESELNFDCGHELVHMHKHRSSGVDCFSCVELKAAIQPKASFFEWEANEGAAELLVPLGLFLPWVRSAFPYFKTASDIANFKEECAYKFQVSPAVIKYRLESLKYEIYQHCNGVNLNEVKILSGNQQKSMGIKIESLNDAETRLLEKALNEQFSSKKVSRFEPEKCEEPVKQTRPKPLPKITREQEMSFRRAEEQWLYDV